MEDVRNIRAVRTTGWVMSSGKRVLSPESVRMVELDHPWIIADGHTKKWPAGKVGDLLELSDPDGRFLATALSDPEERVVARIISRKKTTLDSNWIESRLQQAIELRQEFIDQKETDAYRLVNAEGDGFPGLTIDRYGNCWRPHLKLLVRALEELLAPAGIYEKARPKQTRELEAVSENKNYGRLIAGIPAPARLQVRENGLNFLVSLEKG